MPLHTQACQSHLTRGRLRDEGEEKGGKGMHLEREREREIQIVHSASLAYEDESVFTFCALLRMAVRQWLPAF